jgi:DNA-binding MarR family transcriptional regulator
VERDLVTRESWDKDRRVVWVQATEEGMAIAEAARKFRRGIIVRRLSKLNDRQRASIVRALALLEEVVAEPARAPSAGPGSGGPNAQRRG